VALSEREGCDGCGGIGADSWECQQIVM